MNKAMHRFPSRSTIFRFRFVACLICFRFFAIPAVAGLLLYSLVEHDHHLTIVALGLGAACFVMSVIQWLLARRTRCPLCLTPVLAHNGCSKHRNARPLLGSHRLRVATGILFRNSFHCPYCHEPSVMEVRHRHTNSQARHY